MSRIFKVLAHMEVAMRFTATVNSLLAVVTRNYVPTCWWCWGSHDARWCI